MKIPSKGEIIQKLLDNSLLRQLLYERWFRLAFALVVFIFIFFALFLPKVWRTSAPDFRPVIKVSGLDLVQAWSLRRTAVKAAAGGKFDEAHYAWQAALANNRADAGLVRGALQTILQDPNRRRRAGQAVQEAYWLLRLTRTNLVDLELVSHVLEQYGYFDGILDLTEPRRNELTPKLAAVQLKALFIRGRLDAFDKQWETLSRKADADPELPLYRAAYLTGWGPPGTITQSREQLDAAARDPALRVLACRLKLVLSAHQLDAAEYGRALQKLEEWREDTFSYQVVYWRLLAATGQQAEGARLAQTYPHPPASPLEVVELAQTYKELGMPDKVLPLLERYSAEFGRSAIYLINYARELIDAKRWDDLRKLALRMRGEDAASDQLNGFSYFLEGRAELALGRQANAATSLSRAAEAEYPGASFASNIAAQLLQLGYAAEAHRILARLETPLRDDPGYWKLLFATADRLREVDLLVRAGSRAYELSPNDPVVANNYAAALIITRQNPQEAIKLTLQLLAGSPNSLHAVVNHSAALLLNGRPKEAEALLSRVQTNILTAAQLALYNLDLFETYYGLGQYDRAWAVSELIEEDRLYLPQRKWLEEIRRQLPPKPKTG